MASAVASPSPLKPVAVGGVVGVLEISVTYPLEFLKRTLQLQQQASPLSRAAAVSFRGPIHCALYTLRTHGPLGLYVGFSSFVAFAGPRSAIRWGAYETLRSTAGASPWARRQRASQVEAACGLGAGVAEAALGQTPSQAIATKMLHDASPAGPKRLRGLWHAVHTIYSEHGVRRGFFCGLQPSVIKGGATNCIRFPVYGALKRLLGGDDPSQPAAPLSPAQSVLCGGLAGVVSAIATQPIDTVMAQAMGLESGRFKNSFACARELVRYGGVSTLYRGLPVRCARVFAEVGLQFALFDAVSGALDRLLFATRQGARS